MNPAISLLQNYLTEIKAPVYRTWKYQDISTERFSIAAKSWNSMKTHQFGNGSVSYETSPQEILWRHQAEGIEAMPDGLAGGIFMRHCVRKARYSKECIVSHFCKTQGTKKTLIAGIWYVYVEKNRKGYIINHKHGWGADGGRSRGGEWESNNEWKSGGNV